MKKNNEEVKNNKSKDDIKEELDLFKEIHNLSCIKNKKIIYVNNEDKFRSKEDIYNEVISFINH